MQILGQIWMQFNTEANISPFFIGGLRGAIGNYLAGTL